MQERITLGNRCKHSAPAGCAIGRECAEVDGGERRGSTLRQFPMECDTGETRERIM